MSTTTKKAFKALKKGLRIFFFTLLALIIIVNLFIVLSGRFYIYKGIRNTYLVGQSGPNIYERDIFPYLTLKKADKTMNWVKDSKYTMTAEEESFAKGLETRAILVFRNDSLLFEKYYGDHGINTVSNSFSAAKTVVALLVGIAIEEGKIKSLDEPVGNYLPEFNSQGKEKITIRHLLMMASGLDWEESASNPLSENAESYYGTDLHGLVTGQKVISAPGKIFKYQSGNSQLLGYIVEKATGKSVAEYTQEKIWKRIGTEHDAYWSLDKENGDEKSFCCLYATARDFGRLGKLILQKGKWGDEQVVPLWYMNEMVRPVKMWTEENVPNHRYGLHIWTYEDDGKPVYYCRGIKGQYMIAVPDQNLVIVRLGMERNDNFAVPEEKMKDREFIKANEQKIGHPTDFFEFLELGRKIGASR